MIIDLRSDTVTVPSDGMKEAMFTAKVGDDVFEEDTTVMELEDLGARMFGKEAGLFCPSGTMTNQIALKVNTNAPGELICDQGAHIYNYEGGGIAFNSGITTKLIAGDRGRITADQIEEVINPDNVHFPITQLVSLENTSNQGGGSIYSLEELKLIQQVVKKHQLAFHLDGARIFNALVESDYSAKDIGGLFDTVSICLSKGLGAPIGSLLLGDAIAIKKARRIRKILGGGMRQVGFLAGAGIYALQHNIERLQEDHHKAKKLEDALKTIAFVKEVLPVATNIVVFKVVDAVSSATIIKRLLDQNVKVVPFGKQQIRMVTHLDFTEDMLQATVGILKTIDRSFQ